MATSSLPLAAATRLPVAGSAPRGAATGSNRALILFAAEARHIDLVAATRHRVEQVSGRVRAVLGLSGLIVEVPPASRKALGREKGVRGVFHQAIAKAPANDPQTLAAVAAWNRTLAPPTGRPRSGPNPGAPPTDVQPPPDRPADPGAREAAASEYRRRWQQTQRGLPAELRRSSELGCANNGAGYYDTSLYLAGDIAVGVVYVSGTSGGWTPATTAQTFADVVSALDVFLDLQPNARLAFTYVNEVDGGGNPLPAPANERDHVNDLRNTWCTDWAYLISVKNGGVWPNAYLHGPSLRLDRTWSPFDVVTRHETGHIFSAGDQYAGSASYPTAAYGYLMAAHGNGCDSNSQGHFAGAGECLPDLMSGWDSVYGYNSIIGPFTAGQFGWHDSDGNGVLDVAETTPVINGPSVSHTLNPTTFTATYSGTAVDRPLLDELPGYGDVSINRVAAVQYRIGALPWQDATPADGVFDSATEGFQLTTPPLRNGTYAIELRAINTVGRAGPSFADQLLVTGSTVANTRPFGSLSVAPARAKAGTMITASGAGSRDLETPAGQLAYSWNWGDGSGWTAFQSGAPVKTHVYANAGSYTVQLRVRDLGGVVHLIARGVTAEAYDTPPTLAFSVGPENRHFTAGASYTVSLSVVGSSDAETPYAQLQVQWDADGDGNWDGPWTTSKVRTVVLTSQHYPKSDRRRVRVRMRDTAGTPNVVEAERFVWVIPYNHAPTLPGVGVTFTPSGTSYLATVTAADVDPASWDGVLEYRYDFEGDGIWDTRFEPTPTTTVTGPGRGTLRVQVKDRFHGRVSWLGPPCNPSCQ
jgi:hypothetical protein